MPGAGRDQLARDRLMQPNDSPKVKTDGERTIKREFGEVYDLTLDDHVPGRPGKITKLSNGQSVEVVDLTEDD
jgi:hypothetical protein